MATTEINPAGHAYSPTIRGRVQWFSPLKGFGFIKSDRGKPDIFVHHTAIATWNKQADVKNRAPSCAIRASASSFRSSKEKTVSQPPAT
jgi:hypothetical protein